MLAAITTCTHATLSAELPDDQIDHLLRALDEDRSGSINAKELNDFMAEDTEVTPPTSPNVKDDEAPRPSSGEGVRRPSAARKLFPTLEDGRTGAEAGAAESESPGDAAHTGGANEGKQETNKE